MRYSLFSALKHHTSKIRDFGDLTSVSTFGFRGEALSSLCALSHLSVVSRTDDDATATEVDYDADGSVASTKTSARSKGTTIRLRDLFHSVPVRKKEFNRNIKREFAKMVHVLNAYCIVSTNVRSEQQVGNTCSCV